MTTKPRDPHSLELYRERWAMLCKQRDDMDLDRAQLLAEAIAAGHTINDVTHDNGIARRAIQSWTYDL